MCGQTLETINRIKSFTDNVKKWKNMRGNSIDSAYWLTLFSFYIKLLSNVQETDNNFFISPSYFSISLFGVLMLCFSYFLYFVLLRALEAPLLGLIWKVRSTAITMKCELCKLFRSASSFSPPPAQPFFWTSRQLFVILLKIMRRRRLVGARPITRHCRACLTTGLVTLRCYANWFYLGTPSLFLSISFDLTFTITRSIALESDLVFHVYFSEY